MIGAARGGKVAPAPAQPGAPTAVQLAKRKARKLKGKKSKSKCRCCTLAEIRENTPTFTEFLYRTRYCKYSPLCKFSWVGIFGGLALLFMVLGGVLPPVLTNAYYRSIQESFVYSDVSQWQKEPVVAAAFGGEGDLTNDAGEQVSISIADVSNAFEVLNYGARPRTQEKGPYTLREYIHRHNVSYELGTARFVERKFHQIVDAQLNDVVTIANPAYRYVEALLSTTPEIASSSFEGGSVALLGSWGLRKLRDRFGPTVKQAAFPAFATRVFEQLRDNEYNGSAAGLRAYWRTSGTLGVLPDGTWHSYRLPLPRDGNTSISISDATARALWSWTDRFALTSMVGWQWYLLPISTIRVREWASHYGSIDRSYMADVGLAKRHAQQIADWIQLLLQNTLQHRDAAETLEGGIAPGAPDVPESLRPALDFEDRAAAVLQSEGLVPRANWSLAIGAQLGSNSVMGFAFKLLSDRVGGGAGELSSVAGTLLSNQCPQSASSQLAGSSLFDMEAARESYLAPAIAEVSCWGSRVLPIPDDPETLTFYSKMEADKMTKLIRLFTSGTSVTNFDVPGSSMLQRLVSSVNRLIEAVSVRNSVLDQANDPNNGLFAWVSRLRLATLEMGEAAPGSAEEAAAKADIEAAARGHKAHLQSEDVSLVNAVCNAGFLPQGMRSYGLSCYEAIDIVNYFRYFAREFVWKPNFVWVAPDGRVDPNNMRAGPFIKATVGEVLYGLQDQFYFEMFGQPFPGLGPPNDQDEAAWLRDVGPTATAITVRSGSSSGDGGGIAGSRHMYKYGDEMETTRWVSPLRVDGSYDYAKFPPMSSWDRRYQDEGGASPGAEARAIRVWNSVSERPETFVFLGETRNELLRAWRFERIAATESSPFLRSDVLRDAPFCMRTLSLLPGPQPDTAIGMDLLYGPPHMHGCSADQTRVFSYDGLPQTSNRTDGSFIDVEPTTGRVLQSMQRHGLYLRWQASKWYPHLRPTIGSLVTFSRQRVLHPVLQARIADDLASLNYLCDVAVPVPMFLLGTVSLLGVAIILYFYFYPCTLPGSEQKAAARRRRKERAAQRRAKEKVAKLQEDPSREFESGPLPGPVRAEAEEKRSVTFSVTKDQEGGGGVRASTPSSRSKRSRRRPGSSSLPSSSSRASPSPPTVTSSGLLAGQRSGSVAGESTDLETSDGGMQTAMGSRIGRHLGKGSSANGRSLAEGRRALKAAQQAQQAEQSDDEEEEEEESAALQDGLAGELSLERPGTSKKQRAEERRKALASAGSAGGTSGGKASGAGKSTPARSQSGPANTRRGKFGGTQQVV